VNSEEKIINSRLSEDCLICGTFLTGFGGFLLRLTGLKRSSVNPNVCNRCNMHIEDGKIVEVSILFVDLCSFTSITHELGPEKTHSIVHSFLNTITEAVIKHDGVVDKYIGDAAMALFNVPIHCDYHAANALAVTKDLTGIMPSLSAEHGLELKFSGGLASGAVRVGKLGSNDIKDFTVIGDAVNRASRLQAQARPGEIVLDTGAFLHVESSHPEIFPEEMELKGFPSTVLGYRIPIEGSFKNPAIINGDNKNPIRKRGFPGIAFFIALLGSPCILGAALSPGAIVLSIGALTGASLPSLISTPYFIDQWWVRLPLILFAFLVTGINVYLVFNARNIRQKLINDGAKVELSIKEKRTEIWVLILSFLTILIIILGSLSHHFIMRHHHFL